MWRACSFAALSPVQAGQFAKIKVQLEGHKPSATAMQELEEAKNEMEIQWKAEVVLSCS